MICKHGLQKDIGNKHTLTSLHSVNPNDNETPEERSARMELVRKLQKSFYQPDDAFKDSQDEESSTIPQQGQHQDEFNPNIIHHLPLWRVQWTELPGFQNVLNVHVPHYTHMFRTMFGQKPEPPWYFGHLYLEDGSENLNNRDYALDPDPVTGESRTKAELVGTLMQVVDYKENEEDGRLMLVVQGLEKFKVVNPSAVSTPNDNCDTSYAESDEIDENCDPFEMQTKEKWNHPYATATVELIPDQELIEHHYFRYKSESKYDKILWNEAHILAMSEAFHWHSFEFRKVKTEECLQGGGGISPLTNFDSLKASSLESSSAITILDTLNSFQEQMKKLDPVTEGGPLLQNNVDHKPSISVNLDIRNSAVPDMEYQVWVALDRMVRLLIQANPYKNVNVPVPAQMLNLLPTKPPTNRMEVKKWPGFFQLHKFAETLSMNENALIGTATKTPFVQVDSLNLTSYPDLRRARLFSYVVWFLLHRFMLTLGDDDAELTRQKLLETDSIYERLKLAKLKLEYINAKLKSMLKN